MLAGALLKQAERAGQQVALLVLDDYQNIVEADDVNCLLSTLIEDAPPWLRFIVLTRSVPRFPLGRLSARQELSTLGEENLAFTVKETSLFLDAVNRNENMESLLQLVHDRTEGWAAGIAMVSQSLRYGDKGKVMAVLANPVASAWLVYDYLAEEVFDRQDPTRQDFLVKTSILEKISSRVCDYMLDSASSQLDLLALEDQGLFTISIDPARQTFRYHQLFREFLRQKLSQRESHEAICALHSKAAQFYERDQEFDSAVRHYLRAGEPVKAALVVENVGEQYIFTGFSQTVERWLEALPEDLSTTRPWLLALMGRLDHLSLRNDQSLRLLERALRLFEAVGNEKGQAWAAGEIAYAMYRSGSIQQAIRRFEAAVPMARDDKALRSQLLAMAAMAYREGGMLQQSVDACMSSMAGLAEVEDTVRRRWSHSRATRILAYGEMELGLLEAAERHGRQALDLCRFHDLGEWEEGWVLAHLGAVLYGCGNLEEAIEVLQRAMSLSGRYIRHLQHFIGLWLGNSLRDSGRHKDAEQAYASSSGTADLERLYLKVRTGTSNDAKALGADLHKRYQESEYLSERTTAEIVYGILLRECHEPEKGLEHLRKGTSLLKAHGYRLRLASSLMHQARLEAELSQTAESRESLRQALELAATDNYYHFFWWDTTLVTAISRMALSGDLFPDYVSQLVSRRLDSTSAVVFAPLLQDRRPTVRQRAREILASLPQRGTANVRDEVLMECLDPCVRASLLKALNEGSVSAQGIRTLRSHYQLSWREIEVLVEYYFRPSLGRSDMSPHLRRECAARLSISEHTLRCHINSLRRKLSMPAWVSGESVLDWAGRECLLEVPVPAKTTPPSTEH